MEELTVLSRDCREYRGQPGVPGLEEPESEFCGGETLHPPEEPHGTETGRQLYGGSKTGQELTLHEAHRPLHIFPDTLTSNMSHTTRRMCNYTVEPLFQIKHIFL